MEIMTISIRRLTIVFGENVGWVELCTKSLFVSTCTRVPGLASRIIIIIFAFKIWRTRSTSTWRWTSTRRSEIFALLGAHSPDPVSAWPGRTGRPRGWPPLGPFQYWIHIQLVHEFNYLHTSSHKETPKHCTNSPHLNEFPLTTRHRNGIHRPQSPLRRDTLAI